MNIGIDVRCLQTHSGVRGIGRYTLELIEALARLDADNDYVLLALDGRPLPALSLPVGFRHRVAFLPDSLMKHPLVRVMARLKNRGPRYRVRRVVDHGILSRAARRERLDVLHLPSLHEDYFVAGGRFRCRVVRTCHDLIPALFPDRYLARASEGEKAVYRRQVASFAESDVVVCVSEATRQDLLRLTETPPERAVVVHSGVSARFAPVPPEEAQALMAAGYALELPYWVFPGGASEWRKNLPGTLEAFAALRKRRPEPALLAVLSGMPNTASDLQAAVLRQMGDLGLTGQDVRFLDYLPDEHLPPLFSGAAGMVFPSFYEGFGLQVLEAMACACPVVTSDVSSLPEVAGDAALLADPHEPGHIAAAMARLMDEPDLRAECVRRGLLRAAGLSWENAARKMMTVYTSAGADAAAPAADRGATSSRAAGHRA